MKKIGIFLLLWLCISCTKEIDKTLTIPIEAARADSTLVRNLVLMELALDFPDLYDSQTTLSAVSQPVYDTKGSLRYRAYALYSGNKEKALVYTYIDKLHPGVVARVIPLSTASRTKANATLPVVEPTISLTDSLLDSLLIGFDKAEISRLKASVRAQQQEYARRAEAYWQAVEGIASEVTLASDEQLRMLPLTKGNVITYEDVDEYIIENYNTEALFKTRWKGGCGPSALANAYRGLYTHYNGVYLPIWGDPDFEKDLRHYVDERAVYDYKNFEDPDGDGAVNLLEREWIETHSALTDNGLYADICRFFVYYNAYRIPNISNEFGAALPGDLFRSLVRITKGDYYLGVAWDVHQHIRQNHLPLICLRSSLTHYMCAIGSRYNTWRWEHIYKLFGKEFIYKSDVYISKKWLLVTDNGTDTDDNDYLPLWVEDDFDHFALRLAVKKNLLH